MVRGKRSGSDLTNPVLKTAAGKLENRDRGDVVSLGSGLVLVIDDGADGMSGGAEAAAMAV